jgi:hypothetical protein
MMRRRIQKPNKRSSPLTAHSAKATGAGERQRVFRNHRDVDIIVANPDPAAVSSSSTAGQNSGNAAAS